MGEIMSRSAVKLTLDHKISRKQSSVNRHTHRYKKLKLWKTKYKWEGEYKKKKESEMRDLEEKIARNEAELAELKTKKKTHEKELKAKNVDIWGKAMSKAAQKEDVSVAETKISLLENGYLSLQDIKTVEDDIKASLALIFKRNFNAYSKFDEETLVELRDTVIEFKLKYRIDISNEVNSLIDKNAEFSKVCAAKFDLKDKSLIDYIDGLDDIDLSEDMPDMPSVREIREEIRAEEKSRFAALNEFFGFDSEFLGDIDDYLKKHNQ